MTKTKAPAPTISTLLDTFCSNYEPAATPTTRARIERVRVDLEEHLEEEGNRILTDSQIELLASERELSGQGAFARTMHADDLFCTLDHYLHPTHAMIGLNARRCQIEFVGNLAQWLWNAKLVTNKTVSECAIIELEIALQKARAAVKQAGRRSRG
jgi:hypothetical protein